MKRNLFSEKSYTIYDSEIVSNSKIITVVIMYVSTKQFHVQALEISRNTDNYGPYPIMLVYLRPFISKLWWRPSSIPIMFSHIIKNNISCRSVSFFTN